MNIWEIATNYYQYFLRGTRTTILISLLTVFCGSILGCLIAFMRLSKFKPLEKFASLTVFDGLSETICKGDVVVIIGPSGGGKSTFIRCLNLLEQPTAGKIYFEGEDITAKGFDVNKHRQKVGMVFQQFNLFNNLTVLENITISLTKVKKQSEEESKEKALELLKRVGLEDKANAYPSQLSGGQKQRIAINLAKGDFDIVIAGMASTEERLKSVDFSDPYFKQQQAILIRAEDDALYNKPEDLSGHKVGVQNGTIQVPIANELVSEENVVGLVKAQDLIMELKSGKLDVVYIDYTAALAFAAANDDLTVKDIGIESDSEGQCIGVQKGNEDFVAYLNEKIAEMQEQGLIDQYVAEAQTLAGIE